MFIAGFLPKKGESTVEQSGKFPGSTLGEALVPVPTTLPDGSAGADLYIDLTKFHLQFAADVREQTAELMAVTQRP